MQSLFIQLFGSELTSVLFFWICVLSDNNAVVFLLPVHKLFTVTFLPAYQAVCVYQSMKYMKYLKYMKYMLKCLQTIFVGFFLLFFCISIFFACFLLRTLIKNFDPRVHTPDEINIFRNIFFIAIGKPHTHTRWSTIERCVFVKLPVNKFLFLIYLFLNVVKWICV